METPDNRIRNKGFFRNLLAFLESFWNGSRFSDTVPAGDSESRRRSEGSSESGANHIQAGLQGMGEHRVRAGLDEEVQKNVSGSDNLSKMKNKYEAELPQTREENMANSTFEWVKTERAGEISKFKSLVREGAIEYIVFQDDTRVNSALLGDVVLQHHDQYEVLGSVNQAFEKVNPPVSQRPAAQLQAPRVEIPAVHNVRVSSPVASILEKAKKKKKKVQFEFLMELPSSEVLSIIKENFDASEDELFDYFMSKVDRKKFVASVISSVTDK